MEDKIKANLIESYHRLAQARDEHQIDPWKLEERDDFYKLLVKEKKDSLLEIGAGTGHDSKFFMDNGLKVVATDLTPEMVRLCQEKGLRAYVMDFFNLEFSDESFDAIWSMNCLLHVPKENFVQVLQGIKRVLKPGGLFFMGVYGGIDVNEVWERDVYYPKRFFALYPDEKIKEVVTKVFELVEFRTRPHKDDINFQAMILRKKA